MPTILTHPAVPLALAVGLGTGVIPPRLLAAGVIASIVPDTDVYFGHAFDAPDTLAHRGCTHSLGFALVCGLAALAASNWLRARPLVVFAFVAVATASHGWLDAFTNGGAGIQLLWPLTDERYFMPWQPIAVSPIGVRNFVSSYGLYVLYSEAKWVWAPAIVLGVVMYSVRRMLPSPRKAGRG